MPSHPAWVRGLKQDNREDVDYLLSSHPAWVRGLKPEAVQELIELAGVAPRVGAWIETLMFHFNEIMKLCRTPRGCVD